jgi:hypothetical protein
LNNWNTNKNERQKLQHAYIILTILIILIAGIISLFNAKHGHSFVKAALFTTAAFTSNAIIWSLVQTSLITKLNTRPRRK